jgi:membrane protein DedA with SNARE-associated domain
VASGKTVNRRPSILSPVWGGLRALHPRRGAATLRRRPHVLLPVAAIVLAVVVLAFVESGLPEELSDLVTFASGALRRFGAAASLALLYLEESGVPSPLPGDVYVAYLGTLAAGSVVRSVAAWLGIVAAVTAGSSNLYLVSRRWGHRLVEHRLAAALHVDRDRLLMAERWMARWGPLAIIFGRHLPGLRIPITVMAGVLEVPYRVFAASVAVSTAIWAGVWIVLTARFGARVAGWLGPRPWLSLPVVALGGLLFAYGALRVWRATGQGPADPDAG